MRLHSLRLRNYRGVRDATVRFADGVTIVEGPNEIGKSSIAEAITHLREDKSSSRKQAIKDLQPVGLDAAPEVELHLSTGPYELRYRKNWIRAHSTELSIIRPRPEQLSSDDAHERFLAILAETVDLDLLVALDVAQGDSLEQASLAQISALHRALSESGAEPADHDELIERIEVEHATFFTKSGKETGEYRSALARVPEAEAAHEQALERSRGMDDLVDSHARALARLDATRSRLAEARDELVELEKSAAEVAELKATVDRTRAAATNLERDAAIAAEAQARRAALVGEVDASDRTVVEAAARFVEGEKESTRLDTEFDESQRAADAANDVVVAARSREKLLGRALIRARAAVERDALDERLQGIRVHDDRRAAAQATISSIAVIPADVESLTALATDERVARGAKTAAAAQITVSRLGGQPMTVGDEDVPDAGSVSRAVESDIIVDIPGIAEVTVRPGASPAELDTAIDRAVVALDAKLAALGVADIAEARDRAQTRADAEAAFAQSRSTLAVLLGKDTRESLEADLARAARASRSAAAGDQGVEDGAGVDGAEGQAELPDPSDLPALEGATEAAETATESAQVELDRLRAALEQLRTRRDRARVVLARAQTASDEARSRSERLRSTLVEARSAASDEELAGGSDAAQQALTEAAEGASAATIAYEAADPEALAMRMSNARELVQTKAADETAGRTEVDRLTALIDDRADEGIYETLARAEAELESAIALRDRLARRARAIDLLRTTILHRRDEARRRYVGPFTDRIERLAALVFGRKVEVEVSDDLEIVSRTIDESTVPFGSLSGGTKEQLALIGRLAVASLVDSDSGAPVILDDAFGFADAERLRALNVVLNDVGKSAQVILLTCQPDRFSGIGGASTVSLGG